MNYLLFITKYGRDCWLTRKIMLSMMMGGLERFYLTYI